jgi:hypothetical protein
LRADGSGHAELARGKSRGSGAEKATTVMVYRLGSFERIHQWISLIRC